MATISTSLTEQVQAVLLSLCLVVYEWLPHISLDRSNKLSLSTNVFNIDNVVAGVIQRMIRFDATILETVAIVKELVKEKREMIRSSAVLTLNVFK
jgi:hypothetical protein